MPREPAVESLIPGVHLTTPRRGYVHHGVYAGDGRVIHYAGYSRALRRWPVEEIPLEQFAAGRGFAVQAHQAPKYAGDAAVERARSRLGEDRYRVWSNNCEHFANWCTSGEPRSAQVERIAALARLLHELRGRVSSAIAPAVNAIGA